MASSLSGRERYRPNTQDLGWTEERADQNVSEEEAIFSGVAGSLLFVMSIAPGISRRSWAGPLLAMAGATLLHRGMRNLQARLINHLIIEQQQIDVDNSRAFCAIADPSHLSFDCQKFIHQRSCS